MVRSLRRSSAGGGDPVLCSLAFMMALAVAQDSQATPCVFDGGAWVCRYQVPQGAVTPEPGKAIPAEPVKVAPNDTPDLSSRPVGVISAKEADRQGRLIRRCADASWLSLCTPDDRREAKALREASLAKEKLRLEVTKLAARGQCPDAVKAALEGGDLSLAREIREFCSAPH
jgi:hypothetical protein